MSRIGPVIVHFYVFNRNDDAPIRKLEIDLNKTHGRALILRTMLWAVLQGYYIEVIRKVDDR